MSNFDKLKWDLESGLGGERSQVTFANGRGVSVIRGGSAYTGGGTYELAVLQKDGSLDYSTPVTDDVLGYQTREGIETAMATVEAMEA